ncbi:hypothetical protein KCP73_04720 [Salmonella enterica subsp. enterica]|nr:hypothetical protein KCP73_04720 [Salmonella enterica subsp. enterica]
MALIPHPAAHFQVRWKLLTDNSSSSLQDSMARSPPAFDDHFMTLMRRGSKRITVKS